VLVGVSVPYPAHRSRRTGARLVMVGFARRPASGPPLSRRYRGCNQPDYSETSRRSIDNEAPRRIVTRQASSFWRLYRGVPVAVTVFPGEIHRAPRSWGEQNFHNLIYWNEVDKGGHFAAWEEPELFATEIRAAFRSLR
jgi:hypothetical protein